MHACKRLLPGMHTVLWGLEYSSVQAARQAVSVVVVDFVQLDL